MSPWPRTRLRYVASVNPQVRADLLANQEVKVSFLPMESIGERGDLDLERVRQVSEVRNGYTYFEDGDVAFAKVTPCFENGKGALMRGLTRGAGFGTSELTVLRPRQGVSARFLDYVVRSDEFRQLGVSAMTGAGGLKRVPDEFTRNFSLLWPAFAEQERIANFLDEQTARIDALIAAKERLSEQLDDYSHAETSRLLTHGLGQNEMRPTGSAFVPLAPKHWQVFALKRVLHGMGQGWSPQCENRPAETGEWGVLKVGCVNGQRFDPEQNKALPAGLEPDLSCVLKAGDVLVSRANTRELVGMAALVDTEYPNLLLCDKLYRLRFDVSQVLPEYLVLLLRASSARNQIELGASGASNSMQNISSVPTSFRGERAVGRHPASEAVA